MIVKYFIEKDLEGYKIKRYSLSFCDGLKYEGYIYNKEKEFFPCIGFIRTVRYFKTKQEAKEYITELHKDYISQY